MEQLQIQQGNSAVTACHVEENAHGAVTVMARVQGSNCRVADHGVENAHGAELHVQGSSC